MTIENCTAGPGRRRFSQLLLALLAAPQLGRAATSGLPVLLGIDGEFGLENSTSAQAIELGVRLATTEINEAGGVLGGRPLQIVSKDHRSIPARGIRNIKEFAEMTDLVAVIGGRFSPVVIEQLPLISQASLPFLAVWSAADMIVDNGSKPNHVFRLSLRDGLAMPFMLDAARQRGLNRVGLLLTNTVWGRSNLAAVERHLRDRDTPKVVATAWYNWQEQSLISQYLKLRQAGAQVIVLVANDDEAAVLVREMAALPADQRLPVISHWGVTGGKFVMEAGSALQKIDFSVIQTFSFFNARGPAFERFMASASRVGIKRIEDIESPVGVAQAYDMTHLLAKAVEIAGTTHRPAIRDALEKLPPHDGLIKRYVQPFTPARHEALGPQDLLMVRYRGDGALVPSDK